VDQGTGHVRHYRRHSRTCDPPGLPLQKLGYDHDGHRWRHPERYAIFLGNFIDRGPEQVETYELVRGMIERGSALAVMGNHEFNAVALKTPHPDRRYERLRPHAEKNRQQHAAFLDQVGEDSDLHDEMIAWFKTLPLYLDLEALRVVHACWHHRALETLGPLTDDRQRLTERAWPELPRKGNEVFEAAAAAATQLKGNTNKTASQTWRYLSDGKRQPRSRREKPLERRRPASG
jgi:hypothetical protein